MKKSAGRIGLFAALAALLPTGVSATTIIPITDRELLSRAHVVVRGTVTSTEIAEDSLGRPETITTIAPLEVVKGELEGDLVLHQLGGRLPDGRYFQLWGRPEYVPGHEVLVFAIARAEGGFQTAEMVLGKFEVQQDEDGRLFAVPALVVDAPAGVSIRRRAKDAPESEGLPEEAAAPRPLETFLRTLERPGLEPVALEAPRGALRSVVHAEYAGRGALPQWGNYSGLWRWNNGATAVWKIDGQANITSGGGPEVNGAVATWDGEPNSTINYSVGASGTNYVHANALTSPCGWTDCLAGGGVVGCGGPQGGAAITWRGENWYEITSGEVWVRSFCTLNLYPSAVYQAVVTHELGHTLGLGHSDQTVSPHDVCRGDEDAAQMRSMVQSRTTLGTDDSDAVRWLYGDGGNSCGVGGGGALPPTATSGTASGVSATGATLGGTVNPNGKSTTAYFQFGTTTAYGSTTGSQSIGAGTAAVSVGAAVTNLACGTLYHFRVLGTNSDGTGAGADMTFTTAACPLVPPSATTGSATGIAQSSATLKGSVNPNGFSTSAYFEYGTTTSYGSRTATQALGAGTSALSVSQAVYGLLCNTGYNYRILALAADGTTVPGANQTFTTNACTPVGFYTVSPCRLSDTRNTNGPSGGPALSANTSRNFPVAGICGIPSTATAVAANVAVVMPAATGNLRVYPAGAALPMASSINFRQGVVRANSSVVALGASGQISVQCDMASGATDFFVDVYGYFQ